MKYSKAFNFQYEYYNHILKDSKEFRNADIQKRIDLLKNYYYKLISKEKDYQDENERNTRAEVATIWQTLKLDITGNCVHFYIKDNQLLEFLKNTEIKDLYFFEGLNLPFCKAATQGVKMYDTKGNTVFTENIEEVAYCIHTTTRKNAPIYYLSKTEKNGVLYAGLQVTDYTDDNKMSFVSLPLHLVPKKILKILKEPNSEITRLGINLLYYMRAFPECVIDGIPKGERVEFSFKSKKQQIKISEKIKVTHDENGRVITPHLRRGHFRYLGSDFFTNKKGQTIFIDATAVNSKNNKTVLKHQGAQ